MTIWHVMKTYNEKGVYYQTIPYDVRVIYNLLRLKEGLRQSIRFLWNSRWTEERANRLLEKKEYKLGNLKNGF